ncbi:glycosyltransferase family 2 protein [Rosettibacter firmus]|uniref:glycosyltransferase family 2 protein n=1 Tax=Rosettibacter firmus TaxID=3111522 RepID=UPI00336C2F18
MIQVYNNFNPVVSIILPTFNRINYLERAINSVLKQTFKDWELIIVDDGSTDNSIKLIDNFILKHENIRYLRHSNRKTPLSTNAGILASTGKFITFLGSDDEYKSEHLKLRVDFMNNNTDVDLIHGGVEIIGFPYVKDKNDLKKLIHLSECVIGGTFFGKRNVFFELGGFRNLRYSDDSDFFERAQERFKIIKVDYPTYIYYRDTPDSICTTIDDNT